ncbi:ABC transporter permease [Pelagibacterium lacus]|uniref:ABC transporter permease n=1 Tax=Pelagibacterium lacus TaxID=2282655 RepID=A0A369W898_9HYPH|nr:ABC transporter permease [Pelagibacterium lacus]RDE10055.1 ABC transporter permease [Pelagibacterium lacus]
MTQISMLRRVAEPALWFVGLLVVWEILVRGFAVPTFILPAPSQFLTQMVVDYQRLAQHGWATTQMILIGFVAGAVPGLILAYLIARFRLAEQILYPVVVFIQGLPKITLAPLLLVWFGFSDFPKILLTALITFFPVLVDAVTGFRSIDKRQYYLSRSMGASWWQTFSKFELPTAAPYIFSGFRITVVVAVTVVIVVEWLNSQTGLGYLVLRAMDSSNTPLLFAILFVGSMIGVALSACVTLAERLLLPWKQA